ncbi:ABC transporter permease [Halorubrum trueperi]|uniref:ABC transporter permease n=1 Tax=Halorubrum trueperi TaxID=2004704 RepID=A0ABD5ULV0_9EURY
MSNLRYFVKRTVVTALLIFLVASALFLLFRSLPGSYLDILVARGANAEELEAAQEAWGLNDPLYVQYFEYITNLFTGDMGNSFRYRTPVINVVGEAILNSFLLVAPAITVAYIVGSIFGGFLGRNRGSKKERRGVAGITILGTIPEFFLGIFLLIIGAFWFGIFPTGGMSSVQNSGLSTLEMVQTGDFWLHYALPFLTIVAKLVYLPSLIMRTSVVEISGQDFMTYHRLKGLPETRQLRHMLKHASLPVITLYPISMGRAIGGMVIVETVFNWPGVGFLLVESVFQRDLPVVQFVFFLVAVWVIVGNYLVDIVYSIIDPRVVVEGQDSD